MKLESKHLAPYLPYGLKVLLVNHKSLDGKEHIFNMNSINVDVIKGTIRKPILRPLSDLAGEIERLKKLSSFSIDEGWIEDCISKISPADILDFPFGIVQFLFENHFDVFGLIEKGLAININDLTNQ